MVALSGHLIDEIEPTYEYLYSDGNYGLISGLTMNKTQLEKLDNLWSDYSAAGGILEINGEPMSDVEGASTALSEFSAGEIEVLLQDMRTLMAVMEELKNPRSHKPSDIPSRGSKPTLMVSTTRATIVKWN